MQEEKILSNYYTTKKGYIALFVQDEFLFSIDSDTFYSQNLQKGDVLLPEKLAYLKSKSEAGKAKENALRYLSLRAYGEKELHNKLLLKYDEETVEEVMANIIDLGLICDEDFAAEKAKGMFERGKSKREIEMKLRFLGISDENISLAVDDLGSDFNNAVKILHKNYVLKLENGKNQQVMAAMARRGFSYSTIKSAIEEVLENL